MTHSQEKEEETTTRFCLRKQGKIGEIERAVIVDAEATTSDWEEEFEDHFKGLDIWGHSLAKRTVKDFIRTLLAKEHTLAKKEFASELRINVQKLLDSDPKGTLEQRNGFYAALNEVLTLLPEQESK